MLHLELRREKRARGVMCCAGLDFLPVDRFDLYDAEV